MVRDAVHDEVDKVRDELVQAWVVADRAEGGLAQADDFFVGVVVENGGLDLVKVQDELLADDVLD